MIDIRTNIDLFIIGGYCKAHALDQLCYFQHCTRYHLPSNIFCGLHDFSHQNYVKEDTTTTTSCEPSEEAEPELHKISSIFMEMSSSFKLVEHEHLVGKGKCKSSPTVDDILASDILFQISMQPSSSR